MDTSNLTPEQIQRLLALMQQGGGVQSGSGGSTTWWDPDGKFAAMQSNVGGRQVGGDAGYWEPGQSQISFGSDNGDGKGNSYDANGQYLGTDSRNDGSAAQTAMFLAAALGGTALSGSGLLGGTPGAAGGVGGGAGSAVGGAGAGGVSVAVPGATTSALTASGAPLTFGGESLLGAVNPYGITGGALEAAAADAGLAGAGGLTASGLGTANAFGSALGGGAAAAGASGLGGLLSPDLLKLGGAALGALSSKDQTQTSSKDPWGPAQDWIKQNIASGQALQQKYTDNPFSDAQKTAYGNLSGLINGANSNAPNMSDFINRQMSGGTAYDPRDPYKNIGKGVSQIVGPGPSGLLNYFPGKGG